MDILLACRKHGQINKGTTWEKTTADNFDVKMGTFDTALVEICILDQLGRFINLYSIEICRDAGLITIPNSNRPLTYMKNVRNSINMLDSRF